MRFTRLCLLVFAPVFAFADPFEIDSFLALSQHPMSIRGSAMGAISHDDFALDPSALSFDHALFSAAATRVEYDLSMGFIEPQTREAISASHVAAAFPLSERFAIAAHYRAEPELRGAHAISAEGAGIYQPSLCTVNCTFAIAYADPLFERRDRRYGISAAFKEGAFTFGAGAELHELDEASAQFPIINEHIDLSVERARGRKFVPNAGVRWQASPRVTVAAAFNGGAAFPTRRENCNVAPDSTYDCASHYVVVDESVRATPDAFRASVSFKPADSLTVAAEAVRRSHSDRSHAYHDTTELHAGAELRVGSVALRAGWWLDPARHPYTLFAGSEDSEHYTLGAGFDAGGGARFDIAIDHAAAPALRRVSAGITFAGLIR